ncbi:TlpA disulfide reductase family protein [Bdellovibrio reynosensis]|uniref:TlpA family protein disulfide reductase n=1 Tax=Bdellovibrio reynosensis TaxID=2835041 RepID=A0ABY4C8C9_9BACT|nr:TlpA disulfide reductase family protein [Bdellovibrio reynosensis]UOF01236.1 TlpA family protein disulfide reductase [Bdellovibrio reynosensis]
MKLHVKALIIVLVVAVILVAGYNALFGKKSTSANSTVASVAAMETEGVPSFVTKDLDGNEVDFKALTGKVVILNFWASWCTPCIEEVPSLIKLVKEFKGDVQLIAISGDSSREDIDVFLKSFPELKTENIKIVYDEDRSLMKRFEVARLPESLVVGKDQKLVKKIVGTIDWYNKDSIDYMKALIAK